MILSLQHCSLVMEVFPSDVALGALTVFCPDQMTDLFGVTIMGRRDGHLHQKSMLLLFSVWSASLVYLSCMQSCLSVCGVKSLAV